MASARSHETAQHFANHLERHGSKDPTAESAAFEVLCGSKPNLADGLRRLRDHWLEVREVLIHLLKDVPLWEQIKNQLGADVVESAALPADGDPKPAAHQAPKALSSGESAAVAAANADEPFIELFTRLGGRASGFHRYSIEAEFARGGMGVIYRARDRDLHRNVALKVIRNKPAEAGDTQAKQSDPKSLGRFLDEAQITGQLAHPNIVPVHELGLDPQGQLYFTMKLVEGNTFAEVIRWVWEQKSGWTQTRALSVLVSVCDALAYAHSKSVIHRDVSPANVMVGKFGETYLMDWGLARVLGQPDRHNLRIVEPAVPPASGIRSERTDASADRRDSPLFTEDGAVVGKPAYMSPEQANAQVALMGPQSDVYAVGAMLYELLTGQMPYVAPGARLSAHEVLSDLRRGPPRKLHEVNPKNAGELEAICEKAMARDLEERYRDTSELADDLRAYLEHRVVKAYRTGAVAELRKWVERNKPLAASLAAGLLTLIGGLVVSLSLKHKADASALLAKANEGRALAGETRAKEQEREATQKSNDVLSLSAIQDLKELEDRADALWPADPVNVPKYEAWLSDARLLIEGQAADPATGLNKRPSLLEHEAKLEEIRRRAQRLPPDRYTFENSEDRWWHAQLSTLILDLKAFTDAKTGGLYSSGTSEKHGWGIVKRADFARTIQQRSVDGPEAEQLWDEAIAAIEASPKYDGLTLVPQVGLLPIGSDPQSGLWEFAHLASGEPAERGSDGRLIVTEAMGLVFVLIPGGTFRMGAQGTSAAAPNFDRQAGGNESPVHEVTLSHYFLSKYEMTQGQWQRLTGRNPSGYGPNRKAAGRSYDLRHPVEQVTWNQCTEVMRRLGLTLPSEAQWEFGCRGGTATAWWTGADRESLRGKVNLADQTAKKGGATWVDIQDWPDLEDGWIVHAPVGSFAANGYGLHEVHGNVWEWCLDGYDASSYGRSKDVDPVTPSTGAAQRVVRGGSFHESAAIARSSNRDFNTPEYQDFELGLRPARVLTH